MPMAVRDYYQTLGVPRDAGAEQIKSAYKRLARKYHPDRNPGNKRSEERFKEISEAYAVLGDANKRRRYDRSGGAGFASGFDGDEFLRHFRSGQFSFGGLGGFGDIFQEIFSGMQGAGTRSAYRAQAPAVRGANLKASLGIDFEQAVRGGEVPLEVARRAVCPACRGRGCSSCGGQGTAPRLQRIKVKVPEGVDEGATIRLPGLGEEGVRGGRAGDLYIKIEMRPHPYFRRRGNDIEIDLPVSVSEAACGARIRVPTIDGWATLTLPAGTSSGRRLRLRGKGVRGPRGGRRGDQYAVVQVALPGKLDERSRELLREFERRNPSPPEARRIWERS